MGMYSIMINDNLKIKDREQFLKLKEEYPEAYLSEELFFNGDEGKFYGYWIQDSMNAYNELGKRGIFEGTCEFEYEEGVNILCEFNKNGFRYKLSNMQYDEEWSYD